MVCPEGVSPPATGVTPTWLAGGTIYVCIGKCAHIKLARNGVPSVKLVEDDITMHEILHWSILTHSIALLFEYSGRLFFNGVPYRIWSCFWFVILYRIIGPDFSLAYYKCYTIRSTWSSGHTWCVQTRTLGCRFFGALLTGSLCRWRTMCTCALSGIWDRTIQLYR